MTLTTTDQGADLLVFVLSDMQFALDLSSVRELVHAVMITPLPEAPAVIEGIIDVRGDIVPVYDLRLRFGLPLRALDINDRIVIAWTGQRLAAIRCESADTLRNVAADSIVPAEAVHHSGRQVAGVARGPDGLILIQDLKHFLDDAENGLLDSALRVAQGGVS